MTQKKTLLLGGGGHAHSVIESAGERRFVGYVARRPAEAHLPLPYQGDDDFVIANFDPADYDIHLAVGFNDGCSLTLRRSIIDRFSRFDAASVVAPSAVVTSASTIGQGCAVMARAVVNRSKLGAHSVVNTGAIVEHDCLVGSNVFIGPGAIVCGEVTVGDDVFIGAGAIIRNGVTIASGVSVAMGAVVTDNLTAPGVYAGNPARRLPKKKP